MTSSEPKLIALAGARSEMWTKFGFKSDHDGNILNRNQVICRQCHIPVKYNGNTTNMNSHLQHCLKKSSKNSSISSYLSSSKSKLPKNSERHKDLTNGILKFVVNDLRPFCTVEGEGFREFMNLALPEFDVPSSATITRLCTSMAIKERDHLKTDLQNVSFVCLTLDFWTSRVNASYLGVTCHFILNWKLNSRVLETSMIPETHTSGNITKNIILVQKEWGIEHKTCAIVCDNAPNMVRAVVNLDNNLLVRCAAHSIQLSVNAGLQNFNIKELISKIRKIVGHFHRSAVSQTNLENEQLKYQTPKNKLVQDCPTRWNSTHDMMVSVIKNKNPINNSLSSNPKTENWLITSNDTAKIESIIQVLEPFKAATEVLGGDKYVTSSLIGRIFKNLLSSIKQNSNDDTFKTKLKSDICDDLIKRNNDVGNNVYKAAALDPRYKSLKFLSEETRSVIWEELKIEVQNEPFKVKHTPKDSENDDNMDKPQIKEKRSLLADSDDEDSEVDENDVKFQLKKYKEQKDSVSKDEDPIIWWKQNQIRFPAVAALAMKYLSIVATSVPSERLFSQAGFVISNQRTRLLPNRVNDLLFLNSHFKSGGNIINNADFSYEENDE